jgi:hypothetical protein
MARKPESSLASKMAIAGSMRKLSTWLKAESVGGNQRKPIESAESWREIMAEMAKQWQCHQ